MENNNTISQLDHLRWLANNGILTDSAKNNLYVYGSIVHKDVQAVHLSIDTAKRHLNYIVYLPEHVMVAKRRIDYLKLKKGVLNLFILRYLLKKYGSLDMQTPLNNFVHDYIGPSWQVNLTLDIIDNYKDEPEDVT